MSLLSETDSADIVKVLITLLSGGALTAVGTWIVKLVREGRQSRVVATSDSIKRDRAKLSLEQDRYDAALANTQRSYDDLYERFQTLYKAVEALQDLLRKSEVERAVAVTKLGEMTNRLTECVAQGEELKRRINTLESRDNHHVL